MDKHTARRSVALAALVAMMLPAAARAQESTGTPAAKAEFERGEAAFKEKKYDLAVEAYRKAIDLDPAYGDAHERFVVVSRSYLGQKDVDAAVVQLEATYQGWIRKDPKQAAYYWGLAKTDFYKDPLGAEKACRKAVEADPKFARAWNTLSLFAEMKGENAASREYLKKAADALPDDPGYAFYYARSLKDISPDAYRQASLAVINRFPANDRAAQALYWLAADSEKLTDKIATLERLRTMFPPEKFPWSHSGMTDLFEAYAETDPPKALALARNLMKRFSEDTWWPELATFEESLETARGLIAARKSADAIAVLEKLKPPRGVNAEPLDLLKAEAEASGGDMRKAYERLAPAVAKRPADASFRALLGYGRSLNMSEADVEADLVARREKTATAATPFTVPGYDGRTRSLSDFRGKVVLLTFWYPG